MKSVNEHYVSGPPTAQNLVDIFKGQWISMFPRDAGCESGGTIPLFQDDRIAWLITRLGGALAGKTVAELGPFEGGHSYMLLKAGAARLVGVEGNTLNVLKMTLAREIFRLGRLELLCGELEAWLMTVAERFDVMVASGVLYHFIDPLMALRNMAKLSDTIFLWTHFVHEPMMPPGDPRWGPFTGEVTKRTVDGYTCAYYERSYRGAQNSSAFCGGVHQDSVWMTHDDIVYSLMHFGYIVEEALVSGSGANGPCSCFLARRKGTF